MTRADLHIHSTASDGTRSPRDLVSMAFAESISVISLTDHDTLDGIPEAVKASSDMGVNFIPGVELSVDLEYDGLTAHLLGYFPSADIKDLVDESNPLGKAIAFVQGGRFRRNPEILEKLEENGIYIGMQSVEHIAGGDVVGRPHIAEAMLNAGYVGSMKEAFNRFLAKGKPAYVERDRLSVYRAIGIILESGGIPVIAHPGYIEMNSTEIENLFKRMKESGLAGVEAYYPTHTEAMISTLLSLADELQLAVTGGTDYHGRNQEAAPLGGTVDGFHVKLEDIKDFLTLCKSGQQEVLKWRNSAN